MSELDSRCRALLKAGRLGDEPSFEDEDRVHRALASRIAAAAVVGAAVGVGAKVGVAAAAGKAAKVGLVAATGAGASAAGTTTAVASGFMLKLIGIGMIAGIATVGVVTMAPSGDSGKAVDRAVAAELPTVPTGHVSAISVPTNVGLAVEATAQPHDEAPVALNQPTKPAVSAVASAAVSTLDEEMQLIRSAQRELHSGKASTALGILGEHARRFPRGNMSEDRVALQVLALCASGRGADARAQAAKFMASHPRSPYAGPVSSCAETTSPPVKVTE